MRTNHFTISVSDLPMDQSQAVCVLLNVPTPESYIPTLPDHLIWAAPLLVDQEAVARMEYRRLISESGQYDGMHYGMHAQRIWTEDYSRMDAMKLVEAMGWEYTDATY